MSSITIEGKEVAITRPEKVLFPAIGATKSEMIEYYIRMARYILPWLHDRPFSMESFPDGVDGKHFYQKQRPEDAPEWLEGITLPSEKRGHLDWCFVNDTASLVYMANRANIQTHAWFSRAPRLDEPDIAVFDLDPSGNTEFADAVEAARLIKIILDEMKVTAYPKTSGATGVHIVIPIEPTPFEKVREYLAKICRVVEKANSNLFTTERIISKRGDKVYLDAVQNARSKTIPSPYSVRATATATVSAPVTWEELLNQGVRPEMFTMRNIEERVKKIGDLYEPVYRMRQKIS